MRGGMAPLLPGRDENHSDEPDEAFSVPTGDGHVFKDLNKFLQRVSIIFKMLIVTFAVLAAVWIPMDFLQTRRVKSILEKRLNEILETQAAEDRKHFDSNVRALRHFSKMIVSTGKFERYFLTFQIGEKKSLPEIFHITEPEWMPDSSAVRTFVSADYYIILSQEGKAVEVYQYANNPVPSALTEPTALLSQLSHSQSYMTNVEGNPYILAAKSFKIPDGFAGTLLLAVLLDSDFLIRTLEPFLTNTVVALSEGVDGKIIASTSPEIIIEGASFAEIQKSHLITGKTFFDYGASDLHLQLISLISKEEFESMAMSLVSAGRGQRALTALALAISFAAVMVWLSAKIRKLTVNVSKFAETDLGAKGRDLEHGDELFILDKRFSELREEIKKSSARIEKAAEEKIELERRNLEMQKDRVQLELIRSVTDAVGIGVLENTSKGPRPVNDQMSKFLDRVADPSVYNIAGKDFAEKTIVEKTGKTKVFSLSRPGVFAGREVLLVQDVTLKKRVEEEMLKAQKLESLGILAGGIAHDFNNLLTSILGNISITKAMLPLESDARHRLNETEKASKKAIRLTQQLLTFSKGGEPIKKICNIDELIRDACSFSLSGSNVNCEFDIAEDLWSAEVDEAQINRVINNLIINAQQAMPNGGTIRVKACNDVVVKAGIPGLPSGNYVKISVMDEGVGIKDEDRARIFDPYFSTKDTGSGLGLAAVFSIIKRHDGHIMVESSPGKGATFVFYLPSSEEAAHVESKEETVLLKGEGRILVMDDEREIRDLAKAMLQMLGYQADVAGDGAEAVEMYAKSMEIKKPYDVVILDLTVPGGMSGLKARNLIAKFDPSVKAIATSGYSNDAVLANHEEYGFVECAPKPYNIHELGRILRNVLPKSEENPSSQDRV